MGLGMPINCQYCTLIAGVEVEGALTCVRVSTARCTTVLLSLHSYASVASPPSPRLRESGAAPYSDAHCAVVSQASTSLVWSDRTAPWLHPLLSAAAPRVCPLVITHTQ